MFLQLSQTINTCVEINTQSVLVRVFSCKILLLATICYLWVPSANIAQSFIISSKTYNTSIPQSKIFAWRQPTDSTLSTNSEYLNDIKLRCMLESAIVEELQTLGYTLNQNKPAILVEFNVLDKPSRLVDFDRYNNNLKHLRGSIESTDKSNYNVDPGTVIISFIHANTKKMLWQGFASGVLDSQAAEKNSLMVNEAVRLIFQEFAFLIDNSIAHLD